MRTGEPRVGEDGGAQGGGGRGALTTGLPHSSPRSGQTAGGSGGGQAPLRPPCRGLCQSPAPSRDPNPIQLNMAVLCPIVSEALWPCGLRPVRLLCPWDAPGKNIGVGCHFLLQGIFSTLGSNLCLLHLMYWQAGSLARCHLRRSLRMTRPQQTEMVRKMYFSHFPCHTSWRGGYAISRRMCICICNHRRKFQRQKP